MEDKEIHLVYYEDVRPIEWTGDHIEYDLKLHALGAGHDRFLVPNPHLDNQDLVHYINSFPKMKPCVVWYHEGTWIAKLFSREWKPEDDYRNLKVTVPILTFKRNTNFSNTIEFENDPIVSNFKPNAWDTNFKLIWYLDPKFNPTEEKLWVFSCQADNKISRGIKDMGYLTPLLTQEDLNNRTFQLDVIFISYRESNAEDNWQRVLKKAPWAKRVDGVEGIFNAHRAAAKLSTTDMFYAVDGDAWLVDDFDFNFQPGMFDRDCTHIWRAQNPINGLEYGYGGVKLFSKQIIDSTNKWTTLDMSTSIATKIKVVDRVSNITAFDTDEFSTWRSAFRECVKLCYNIQQDPSDTTSHARLDQWLTEGEDHKFGKYSMMGAADAIKWAKDNMNDYDSLRMINNRTWLENQYESRNR